MEKREGENIDGRKKEKKNVGEYNPIFGNGIERNNGDAIFTIASDRSVLAALGSFGNPSTRRD